MSTPRSVPVAGPGNAWAVTMPRTNLRLIVATIEGELAELTAAVVGSEHQAALVADLRVSWARLVQMLPLAEAGFRGCPVCMRVVPRVAMFCGYCFSKLSPLATSA